MAGVKDTLTACKNSLKGPLTDLSDTMNFL